MEGRHDDRLTRIKKNPPFPAGLFLTWGPTLPGLGTSLQGTNYARRCSPPSSFFGGCAFWLPGRKSFQWTSESHLNGHENAPDGRLSANPTTRNGQQLHPEVPPHLSHFIQVPIRTNANLSRLLRVLASQRLSAGGTLAGDRWQSVLSRDSGVSQSYLAMIAVGDRPVTDEVDRKVAEGIAREADRLRTQAVKPDGIALKILHNMEG
jgi:hypothetical protein